MRDRLAWDAAQRQTCKVCGRPDKFNFDVPDDHWSRIVPDPYRRSVICLGCFDTFALAAGQEYALTAVQFVGDQGVFELEPRRVA